MALPFTNKRNTWGQLGAGLFFCFVFLFFWLLKLFCGRHRRTCRHESAIFFVTEDTGHLLFSAFSWWSLYYVKGFCALKMLPLLCQCQFLAFFPFSCFFFFHRMIHRTTVLAAMSRFFFFRGEACLSESNASLKSVLFLKYCLCPAPSLCCHACWSTLSEPHNAPLLPIPPTNKLQKTMNPCRRRKFTPQYKARNSPDLEYERSSEDFRLRALPVSLD